MSQPPTPPPLPSEDPKQDKVPDFPPPDQQSKVEDDWDPSWGEKPLAPETKTGSNFAGKLADGADAIADRGLSGSPTGEGATKPGLSRPHMPPKSARPGGANAAAASSGEARQAGKKPQSPTGKKKSADSTDTSKPADERIANAAGRLAAKEGLSKLSGGVTDAAKKAPVADKVLNKTEKLAGAATEKSWKIAKVGIGIALSFSLLAGMFLAGSLIVASTATPDRGTDACADQVYTTDVELPRDAKKSNIQVVEAILRASAKTKAGPNTAAFAIYIAAAESGLTPGVPGDDTDSYVGSFQQSKISFENNLDKYPGATFDGEATDPRLNPENSATHFIWMFRELLKVHNGEPPAGHESQEDVLKALAQLGVDISDPSNLWNAWKKADLSKTLTDPKNVPAILVLSNAVQGHVKDSLSHVGEDSPAGRSVTNYANKFNLAVPFMRPVLNQASTWRSNQSQNTQNAYNASLAADAAAPGAEVDGLGSFVDAEGNPISTGVFVLGDSITRSIKGDLEDAGYVVDAADGRAAQQSLWLNELKTPEAQAASTWIIALGTNNDGRNPDAVAGWVKGVKNARNKNAPQQVYWVLPWRPDNYDDINQPGDSDLGPTTDLEVALTNAANASDWLQVLDWPTEAEAGWDMGWFANDKMHIHPNDEGRDALTTVILGVGGSAGGYDDMFSDCVGGYTEATFDMDFSSVPGATIIPASQYPNNPFKDGPAPVGAEKWVPAVLERSKAALIDSPCDTVVEGRFVGKGCPSLCAQLAARLHGQVYSGYNTAYLLWKGLVAKDKFRPEQLVHRYTDPDGYSPPVGAMLFWFNGEGKAGHVATYVGNGYVISNDYINGVPKVVLAPASKYGDNMTQRGYGLYLGWALPDLQHWTGALNPADAKLSYAVYGKTHS